jgi:hypothetical protein
MNALPGGVLHWIVAFLDVKEHVSDELAAVDELVPALCAVYEEQLSKV